MKHKNHLFIFLISIFVSIVALGVNYVYKARFWPFSTGTNVHAFLGTTFGMSEQEVRRTLEKYSAELLATRKLASFNEMAFPDERKLKLLQPNLDWARIIQTTDCNDIKARYKSYDCYHLFMPSIELFGFVTTGDFTFFEGKLAQVGISLDYRGFGTSSSFTNFPIENFDEAIEAIENALKKTHPKVRSPHGSSTNISDGIEEFIYESEKALTTLYLSKPYQIDDQGKAAILPRPTYLLMNYKPAFDKLDGLVNVRNNAAFR